MRPFGIQGDLFHAVYHSGAYVLQRAKRTAQQSKSAIDDRASSTRAPVGRFLFLGGKTFVTQMLFYTAVLCQPEARTRRVASLHPTLVELGTTQTGLKIIVNEKQKRLSIIKYDYC